VYGYSENESEFLIVMEYVDGGSLRSLLDDKVRYSKLSFQDKWNLMLQAALAVEYLHERGIVHRDIKSLNYLVRLYITFSNNIKITKDGKTLKLADFGLAKNETIETMRDSSFVGTERFMAPELFEDQKVQYFQLFITPIVYHCM
jgi:serine/threonine protein kinase